MSEIPKNNDETPVSSPNNIVEVRRNCDDGEDDVLVEDEQEILENIDFSDNETNEENLIESGRQSVFSRRTPPQILNNEDDEEVEDDEQEQEEESETEQPERVNILYSAAFQFFLDLLSSSEDEDEEFVENFDRFLRMRGETYESVMERRRRRRRQNMP